MPTYEYECQSCHGKFELFQSITERPVRKCPHCGRPSARRLIGAGGGIIFRGSGFYQTDYRSAAYKADAKADSAGGTTTAKTDIAAGTTTAKSESGSDTKGAPAKKEKKS